MADQRLNESLVWIQDVPNNVAELTGGGVHLSIHTVREWVERGTLKGRKIGGRVYVTQESINEALKGDTE
jgi:hypothetical protein